MDKVSNSYEAAIAVLSDWSLEGSEISLIKERENAVFEIITSCRTRYALRIHRANYHSDKALLSELLWMAAVQETEINVPQVIPTLDKRLFSHVEINNDIRQVDLFEWVEGEQLGSVEEGLGENLAHINDVFTKIGETAGLLHNQSSQWQQPSDFERLAWDANGLIGEQPNWGCFWKLDSLTEQQKALLARVTVKAKRALTEFGREPQRFSMIHADFSPENILVNGNKIQLIDFDDAGMGWHLFEIATALYSFQSDPHYDIAKSALLRGYRNVRSLSEQDIKQLPLFMALRGITYLSWLQTRQTESAAQALAADIIASCMLTVKQYLSSREEIV